MACSHAAVLVHEQTERKRDYDKVQAECGSLASLIHCSALLKERSRWCHKAPCGRRRRRRAFLLLLGEEIKINNNNIINVRKEGEKLEQHNINNTRAPSCRSTVEYESVACPLENHLNFSLSLPPLADSPSPQLAFLCLEASSNSRQSVSLCSLSLLVQSERNEISPSRRRLSLGAKANLARGLNPPSSAEREARESERERE